MAVPGDFAWLEGDLDALEARVAESLNSIESASPTASRALLQLPWLADEVLLEERLALFPIENIARGDRVLAEKVVALPWLADDVQGEELLALESIRDIVREDPELARTVVDAPGQQRPSPTSLDSPWRWFPTFREMTWPWPGVSLSPRRWPTA